MQNQRPNPSLAKRFWERYRTCVTSDDAAFEPDVFSSNGWTVWSRLAACRACEAIGWNPRPELSWPGLKCGPFDLLGLVPRRRGEIGLAFEEEGGRQDDWKAELDKLCLVTPRLRVLFGYSMSLRKSEPAIREHVNSLDERVRRSSEWLFCFGPIDSAKDPSVDWLVWTYDEGGLLTELDSHLKLNPRRDVPAGC